MSLQLGLPGDIPVPGDYNGTGKVQIAVWRPYVGYVFPNGIGSGPRPRHTSLSQEWTLAGEIP
ncbi:MAG: hypothetical protein JO270_23940 [Acidobacteriaceae bacterium]|nr:hypothetical protein [Acidobacteriaceae bacterium]